MEPEQDLRRSGRSTRRTSIVGEADSYDDEEVHDSSGLATPPPTTPKKSRKSSIDDNGSGLKSSLNAAGVDESKHSFQFNMTKEAFLKDLYSFMQARGQPISKLPSLGYQELDLYLLYQLVIARGGMDEVTRRQEWKLVYQDLGIPTMSTSASYNTRTNYKKYLYLYELEHCDFPDKNRPKDSKPKYQIGDFIRIVSSVFEGQVFYARILKSRYRDGKYQYYVNYNGWNSSHDEWMREDVLDPLLDDERAAPEMLANPPPSRSSKSNHLIYDPNVSEKVINNLVAQKSPKPMQNPLSPASPAAFKKSRKAASNVSGFNYYESGFGPSSEEEEAANELIMGIERYSSSFRSQKEYEAPSRNYQTQVYKPVEVLRYPMRSDPGEDIAKILEDKRNRPHEQDLIHCNRLHTHVLMKNGFDEDERERRMIAELLKSVKIKIQAEEVHEKVDLNESQKEVKMTKSKSNNNLNNNSRKESQYNDPRSLHDIQESLVSLQTSLLATQNSYKHTMRALKKHHGVQVLPPLPVQKFPVMTTERVPVDTAGSADMISNLILVIEFVQRILQIWLNVPREYIGIRRLSAAMTNTVYIISNSDCNLRTDEPRKLLLRIYGEGVDNILDKRDELDWFVKLSKARAGPRLLATFQNGRMEEYIESVTLTPRMMRDSEISRLIAKAMAKFHRLEVERDEVVLWTRIENWRNEARKAFKSLLKRFSEDPKMVSVLHQIKSHGIFEEGEFINEEGKFKKHFDKLVNYESPIVPCHNDLQHGNILLNDFNEIIFIDYEYGGMNYAAYDIANHFCEWASDFTDDNPTPHIMNFEKNYPNLEQREQFIREYLTDTSDGDVSSWIAAVEDFKELSHLLWAYWGIIQRNNSTIDFDYLGYSLMRLEAMRLV